MKPFARAIAVSFTETVQHLGPKAVVTGNPVRAALPSARDSVRKGNGTHLLIMGGSQGARGLNSMVELAIPQLAEADVGLTVTHQTGKQDVERLREAWAKHGIPATVVPFINPVGEAYARADVFCGRAGATTCAELAYCGIPSILVPFPGAAAQHQHDNARAFERVGASIMVEEEMDGTPLTEAILRVTGSTDEAQAMSHAAAAAGRPDAAGAVADLALALIGRGAPTITVTGDMPGPVLGTRQRPEPVS